MPEELDVRIDSGVLHLRSFGDPGAPLVLGLPGLTSSGEQLAVLGERLGASDRRFVAVDLRGRGGSDRTGEGTYGWERHARDVLALATALGADRFALVGLSMGASVAMQVAELAAPRLRAVVLLDVAGRVDPGVGPVVAATIAELDDRADPVAVAEDRRSTLSQDPYARWRHLTMPTLLLRATQGLAPCAGHVVPADDRDRFAREVERAEVVEVDATHLTIADHPATADVVRAFLSRNP